VPSLPATLYFLQATLVVLGSCTAQHDAVRVRITELLIPLADPAPDEEPQVLRIVDGITGAPIAGAEVFAVPEQEHPLPAVFVAAARAVTDADGFAQMPARKGWTMARAAGYGPGMTMDARSQVMALAPGIDARVRAEDWRGVPLAGQMAGFCCGCGHTCDLANAITDGDGVATFRCIDPGNGIADLYLENAPIEFQYDDIRWQPGDPPDRHQFGFGIVVHGVVLEPDGTAAAGAIVGLADKHRGPWSVTDASGHFVVGGLDPNTSFQVVHRGRHIEFTAPRDRPCTLRLPAPNGEAYVEGNPAPQGPTGIVRCRTRVRGGEPPDDLEYEVRGPLPGDWLTPASDGQFELVTGRYEVRAHSPTTFAALQSVEVAAGTVVEAAFELDLLPTATIAVAGLSDHGTVWLNAIGSNRNVTAAVRAGERVAIDPAADYAVVLDVGEVTRKFPCAGWALLNGSAPPFRWFRPTHIRARLVEGHGEAVAADVALIDHIPCPDVNGEPEAGFDPRTVPATRCAGTVALESMREGRCYLWVRPHDRQLRPRLVPFALPYRGDDVAVDLGTIVLSPTPRLLLHAADGTPLQAGVAWLRTGVADFREHCFEVLTLGDDGSWIGPDLEPGQGVLLPADDEPVADADGWPAVTLPFRARITDAASQELTVPAGRLRIAVGDETGKPLDATVLLCESRWPAAGRLSITQAPAGSLRLFVGCAGRRTAIVDVDLAAGEQRELRVALPAR